MEETEITIKLDNYEKSLYSEKKILAIDDDEEELNQIANEIRKRNIRVDAIIFERDCIELIKNGVKYDLIIIDDELNNSSALSILQELQEIESFKTSVVVMINKNKQKIKMQYLKDGFFDYISKDKLDLEIDRIINTNLN